MIDRTNMFLNAKALEFIENFVRSYKGEIDDNDFFSIFESHLDQDDVVKLIQKNISSAALEKAKTARSPRIELDTDPVREMLNCLWNNKALRTEGRTFIKKLALHLKNAYKPEEFQKDPVIQRFNDLCTLFQLNEMEADALMLAILHGEGLLERFFMKGCRTRANNASSSKYWEMLSLYLGFSVQKVRFAYSESQKLRRLGCTDNDCDVAYNIMIYMQGLSNEPLSRHYFSKVSETPLPWTFYGSLTEDHGAVLKELIRNRDTSKSFHVLLYGAPGTGKTSFTYSLANELGMSCYSIAQRDLTNSTGGAVSPEFRLSAIGVCDQQIGHGKDNLIMIDEADRILTGGANGFFAMLFGGGEGDGNDSSHEGKGILNNLMDSVNTPCIWITNSAAERLPASSRRRFDYSIKFDKLTLFQRQMIFKNNIEAFKLGHLFTEEQIEQIANKYEVSAGGITQALSNLRALSPDAQKSSKIISKLLDSHCKLLRIPTGEKQLPAKDYSLEGLNIKGPVQLPQIIEAVRNFITATEPGSDSPRMNLLLSGAPGTGKTEFVKYLGSVVNKKVVVRMGSDLLGKYVGQTEQRIREAFEEAEAEKSILFFDEIDGLLRSREMAGHGWEVTQVNEVLHQMENFNGVFIGSTNFNDNLDAASIRRFTFKLQFDTLDTVGKQFFFEKMFKSGLTDDEKARLSLIPNLAPGDFRTVRQSLYYLGKDGQTNMERIKALEQEVEAKQKKGVSLKKIGF
jgi:SpoVK/Ycf46/Vps4 family AAA+-type ATPase